MNKYKFGDKVTWRDAEGKGYEGVVTVVDDGWEDHYEVHFEELPLSSKYDCRLWNVPERDLTPVRAGQRVILAACVLCVVIVIVTYLLVTTAG